MKLIVGLGNPGREYRDTRHNIGFMVADDLVRRFGGEFALAPSQVTETLIAKRFGSAAAAVNGPGAQPMLVAKPLTFMNRSGDAVAGLLRYYGLETTDLLVVVDDVALPFGRIRVRARGSAGGHNGLKSIAQRIGTTEFPRLRLGVGRGDARRDLANHVLSTFEADERADLDTFVTRAAEAAEMFAAEGIARVMNLYNPDAAGPDAN